MTKCDAYKSTVGTQETVYTYTYDNNGNITRISYSDGNEITYEYDNLGQLKRENNTIISRTYKYEYDNAGNIILKSEYAYTPANVEPTELIYSYTYVYSNGAWGDQLTSFNGNAIDYDEQGNPTDYYNGAEFDWIGRRLVGATYGNKEISFTYDDNGIRQSKTVNGVTTNYYWLGSMLVAEETEGVCTVYLYDNTGAPIGFQYRTPSYAEDVWDTYLYEKNLHGDILAVYSLNGTKLVSYTYDAWGNFITTYHNGGEYTPAASNPYTYRGYYYDTDLGLYYLMSRYYDSNTGRFINVDSYVSTGQGVIGYNMYAYCNNNPVMYVDLFGERACSMVTLTQPCLFDPEKVNGIPREEKLKRYAIRVARTKATVEPDDVDVVSVNISFSMGDFKSIDPSARKYFYEELRAMSEEVARREGIPLSNLMTVEHIEWETLEHMKVYDWDYFKWLYEHTNTVDLNVEETEKTLKEKGKKAITEKLWPF